MNRGELKTRINQITHRTTADADLNTIIDEVGIQVGRDAQLYEQEEQTTYSSITADELIPPADFLKVVSLRLSDGCPLTYYTIDQANSLFFNASGTPQGYTIEDRKIKIFPAAAGQDFILTYMQTIPALTSDGATNDVLTNWPNTYKYGCALEVFIQQQDDEAIATFKGLYDEEIITLSAFADEQRLGAYSELRVV